MTTSTSLTASAVAAIVLFFLAAPTALAQSAAAIDSDSVSGTVTRDCSGFVPFVDRGTVTLRFNATLEARVTPYIDSADDTGTFSATVRVNNSLSRNCGGGYFTPLNSDPHVYFGDNNGVIREGYDSATPFTTTAVRLNREFDSFANGNYRIAGSDGAGGFAISVGVSVGPVGIGVGGGRENSPIILLPTENSRRRLTLGNVVWTAINTTPIRGSFREQSEFELSNVGIRTGGDDSFETGLIEVNIPVYKARAGALAIIPLNDKVGDLTARLNYIRGDRLKQPEITFSASRKLINVGDTVTATVTIRNRSRIELTPGEVDLVDAALAPVLAPSVGSRDFGTIPPFASRSVDFELTGSALGRRLVEARVTGRWGGAVPTSRAGYSDTVEISGGIIVTDQPLPLFLDDFED